MLMSPPVQKTGKPKSETTCKHEQSELNRGPSRFKSKDTNLALSDLSPGSMTTVKNKREFNMKTIVIVALDGSN